MDPIRQMVLLVATVGVLASCSKGKAESNDPCEKARSIYMGVVRQKGEEAIASIKDETQKAALKKQGEAELAGAETRFVGVCKELGADKVLACIEAAAKDEKAVRGDAACMALGKQLMAKLYPTPTP